MHTRYARSFVAAQPPPPLDSVVESARLCALQTYRILTQEDLTGLDRLSEHAAMSLGGTFGAVSFVDEDRVWFAGSSGLDRHDVARRGSFCEAVVRSGAPLLVPDSLQDPRFWEDDLVRAENGVRCYAGVPLIDEGGYALGAISVMDPAPGVFGAKTLSDLSGLASVVERFLAESRAARAAVAESLVQGWLGVRTKGGDYGTPGLIVLSVARGSPAEAAGLRPTDLLLSVAGRELYKPDDVVRALAGRERGEWVGLRYRRGGQWLDGNVQIRPGPSRLAQAAE